MSDHSAIVDIGSNSVRLVIYGPPRRAPSVLFNEKISAGLGRGLASTGALDEAAMEVTLRGLKRFAAIIHAMDVRYTRVVATAAVRDATNGAAFIQRARDVGLEIEVLSGEAEAEASGYGIISAFPLADGIVGDLGGGSLELVRVARGEVGKPLSLPLGVLRLPALRTKPGALREFVRTALADACWSDVTRNLPFYLVGGSWRALARVHMAIVNYPLPIIHAYTMPTDAPRRALALLEPKPLKSVEQLAGNRAPVLGHAAALLDVLASALRSNRLIVSAAGLREGLLYEALDTSERAIDPLLASARETGRRAGRFEEHGDLVDRWIAPIFANEAPAHARVRHAASLLSDIAWDANPDFRSGRAADIALYENWTGIDAAGRGMLAQALYTSFGEPDSPKLVPTLIDTATIDRARSWGLAIRLAQRLGGGAAGPLKRSRIRVDGGKLVLGLDQPALYGDSVAKRHKQLANAMKLQPVLT